MNNNLSLIKIIGGISKTLNVANQIIPIYKQVKPIITNSSKYLSQFQSSILNNKTPIKEQSFNDTTLNSQNASPIQNNGPIFFQ